ncbi:hypothetical protein Tco_1462342 [Tanacetum coccineum]
MEREDEERCELFDQERSVCNIRRFEMIKYSFSDDEEYVAVKENEYDDLTSTSKEAIRTYQDIFRRVSPYGVFQSMDTVTSLEKKSTKLVKDQSSGILCVCCTHAGIQTHLQHTFLLINSTWRIYQAKHQGSFSF